MRFKEFLAELDAPVPTHDEVDEFEEDLKNDLGLAKLSLWYMPTPRLLGVKLIAVDPDKQNQGLGTQAMKRITGFADKHKLKIVLTPAEADKRFGTTSKERLIKFYERFGFTQRGENMQRSPR